MKKLLLSILAVAAVHPVLAEGTFRFVTLEFAPFIYGENKQVAGPGRDVIAAVCERAKVACSFDIYPWRRAQSLMRAGNADGMMVIGRNAEREEWLDFSPPLFRTEYGFFVRGNDAMDYSDPAQVAGIRIGVFAPSNTETQLRNLRENMIAAGLDPFTIDGHPDDAAGMRKLAAGRLDAVYSNRDRGWEIVRAEGLEGQVHYAGGDKGILYYSGITKAYADRAAVARFFEAWHALFAEGAAQKIIEGYGLEPATVE
jgi:polar amino acid transport system substrate-binding protein